MEEWIALATLEVLPGEAPGKRPAKSGVAVAEGDRRRERGGRYCMRRDGKPRRGAPEALHEAPLRQERLIIL